MQNRSQKISTAIFPSSFGEWRTIVVLALILTIVFCFPAEANSLGDFFRSIKDSTTEWLSEQAMKIVKLVSGNNVHCLSMGELQERYKDCYSCMTMKVLLEAFMVMASKTYEISKEAGTKLLGIGSILWVAFFTIKHVSSLTNPEAPSMLNELAKFAFKVIVAYVLINAGISILVGYFINPILATGADFATAFLADDLPTATEGAKGLYKYNGPADIISPAVLDKILLVTEGISNKVASNMVIGNGLMCFADKVGYDLIVFTFPNIWLWLCGAVIWFVGFLLVMFVSYYLLDISFKIGFAIIIMPVVIGLWPFKVTSSRVSVCFSIILKSAATFAFLSLCATFSAVLIDQALFVPDPNSPDGGNHSGVEQLFSAFANDQVEYVSKLFSITGPTFLVFCICFFYAVKLIGKNQTLVNRFFPDKMFGDVAPMHSAGTMVTDKLKGMAMSPVNLAKDIAVHSTGKAAGGVVKGAMGVVSGNAFKGGQKAVGGAAQAGGKATQAAGKAVKGAGKAMEYAGKGVEAAGKGVEAAGNAAGALAQLIPVVGTAAGAAVKTASTAVGKTAQLAGKVTQVAGKVTQAAGETVKQTGKIAEQAGNMTSQMADDGAKNSKEDKKQSEAKEKDNKE